MIWSNHNLGSICIVSYVQQRCKTIKIKHWKMTIRLENIIYKSDTTKYTTSNLPLYRITNNIACWCELYYYSVLILFTSKNLLQTYNRSDPIFECPYVAHMPWWNWLQNRLHADENCLILKLHVSPDHCYLLYGCMCSNIWVLEHRASTSYI